MLDVEKLIEIVGECGLLGFVCSFGGLDIFVCIDMVDNLLFCLIEVFECVVSVIGMIYVVD